MMEVFLFALVYLYASMGLLMMTGIMAIFEMAISFDAQQMNFRPPRDSYHGSNAQMADRDLMALLATPGLLQSMGQSVGAQQTPLTGQALCDQLLCRMDATLQAQCQGANAYDKFFDQRPVSTYRPGLQTTSSASALVGSCALSSPKSDHRVLIAPNPSMDPPYRLFSCSLDEQSTCSFELN